MMKKGEPKTLTYLSLTAVVLFLAWMAFAVVHNHMPVKETFWALTPPIIAIALALITKEVYSSLFLGILTGAKLLEYYDAFVKDIELIEMGGAMMRSVNARAEQIESPEFYKILK